MFIVSRGMDADGSILASNTVDGGLGSVETIGKLWLLSRKKTRRPEQAFCPMSVPDESHSQLSIADILPLDFDFGKYISLALKKAQHPM